MRSRVLGDRRLVALLVAGAALRLVAVAGIRPTIYVDSIEYQGPAFFGGDRRPWAVPLLYELVGESTLRVLAHAVLGAAAWAALAVAVAEAVRHPTVRLVAAGAVLAMGLTTPVTNYDTTITSETVAISLTVALLAAWMRVASTPSVPRALGVVAVAVFFAFTRNDHPLLVAGTAVLALAWWALRGRRRAVGVLAAGLVVVSVWSVAAWRRNDEIERFNLAMVVANRILPHPDDLAWFEGWGMPRPRDFGRRPDGDFVLSYAQDPAWNDWASEEGTVAYARFLVTHPGHLLLEPWTDVLGLRATSLEAAGTPTVLLSPADRYGRVHPVLPEPVEAVLFGPGNAGSVLLALAGLAGVAAAVVVGGGRRWRATVGRLGPARVVALVALVVSAGHLLLVWHASPNELGRLAMVPATTAHAATLVLVAVTADRAVEAAATRRR